MGDTALTVPALFELPSEPAYRNSDSSATWVDRAPFVGADVEGVEGTCPALATFPMNHDYMGIF